MSITVYKFIRTKEFILGGGVRLMADDIKMALLAPGFKYKDSMVSFANIKGLEIPSTVNYPAGGLVIRGVDVTTVNSIAELRIGDMAFERLSATISHLVIYADVVANGIDKPLI